MLQSPVTGAQVTSQGRLDREHVSFPTSTGKRTLGGCTTPQPNHVPKRKHDDNLGSMAKHHKRLNRTNDLALTTDFRAHLPEIVELQSRWRGKLVRAKITANRRPRSMAVLFPGVSSTITLPPVLLGASASYHLVDTSIRQRGANNHRDTFGSNRKYTTHDQDIDKVHAVQSNTRESFTHGTRDLGNYLMGNSGNSPEQLRQDALVGLPNQQAQLQPRRSTDFAANRNGTNRQSGATTAVPPSFAPPSTEIPNKSRPRKRHRLTQRTEPPRLQDQGDPSIIGCPEPSGQAVRPGSSKHLQPSSQAQTASQSRQLLQARLPQRPHEPKEPGKRGRHCQPLQPEQPAPSSAPKVLPPESSEHHGQNRANGPYPCGDVQELDGDNSYFAAAYSEFLVAKAFEHGAARYTFEQHHTTPKLIANVESAYLRFLAAKYPQESDYYRRVASSLRRYQEEPATNANGGGSGGHGNGGS